MSSNNRETLCYSKNEKLVWYDPAHSHTATHFEDTPELQSLAVEVIQRTNLTEAKLNFAAEMGRIVGLSDGVITDETDEIVWAKRKNRDTYDRFSKTRGPVPCSQVAISLEARDGDTYELMSSWIGPFDDEPPHPGTPEATTESDQYWQTHALAWGTQEIQPGTETTICPW